MIIYGVHGCEEAIKSRKCKIRRVFLQDKKHISHSLNKFFAETSSAEKSEGGYYWQENQSVLRMTHWNSSCGLMHKALP
jgi:tRNA G18 (ribose-2'-O)-methylase SpoU